MLVSGLPAFVARLSPVVHGCLMCLGSLIKPEDPLAPNATVEKQKQLELESDHPYPAAAHQVRRLCFPKDVSIMLVEFDARCKLFQVEDTVSFFIQSPTSGEADQLLKRFNATTPFPKRGILVPGNQLKIVLSTATCYQENVDRKERPEFFGFRILATGFSSPTFASSGARLERELAFLGGVCASTLLESKEEEINADNLDREHAEKLTANVLEPRADYHHLQPGWREGAPPQHLC
jgi:hypothetical protein